MIYLKKHLIKTVNLFIYLFSVAQVARRTILSDSFEIHYWSYSELLIYYPNRFIRRGLIGQIIQFIDNDGALLDSTLLVIFVNFCFFLFFLYLNLKTYELTSHQSFLLLMSTFGAFQVSIYNQYFHRKEMFLITLFLIINLILKNKLNGYFKFLMVLFLTIISILIHEGVALLMFPFVYYLLKQKTENINFHNAYFILSITVFIAVILNSGSPEIADQIRSSLPTEDRILFETGRDAITTIGWSIYDTFTLTTFTLIFSGSMFLWLFYIALLVFSIHIILNLSMIKISNLDVISLIKDNLYFLLILPIFIVGFDWGRWIFSLFYFLFFTIINIKSIEKTNSFRSREILFLVISFFTIMPECCLEMTRGDMITKNLHRVFESLIFHLL
ncbi:hypothetical protein N9L62_01960 [Candidatus Actinomarina sp.]|nr:hypothetical protein [Candidatus Actinomarina sp.]